MGPALGENPALWSGQFGMGSGHGQRLRYDKAGKRWLVEAKTPVQWAAPQLEQPNRVLYRYGAGAYGFYPQNLSYEGEPFAFEHGVRLLDGHFRRYIAQYGEDRWVSTISVEEYSPS